MTGLRRVGVLVVALAAGLAVGLAVELAVASAGMATDSQQRPYRLSDQQLKDLVDRTDNHKDAFHASFNRAVDRSPINGSPAEGQIGRSVKDFEQAADLLRNRVSDHQSSAGSGVPVTTHDCPGVDRRAARLRRSST